MIQKDKTTREYLLDRVISLLTQYIVSHTNDPKFCGSVEFRFHNGCVNKNGISITMRVKDPDTAHGGIGG